MTAGACGPAFAIASGALKGALIGAATGAVGGGMKSDMDYYEEHGTIDGSGSQILEDAAQGFAAGAISGAASGAMAGAGSYAKHPEAYCFVAGTLVLTAVGLTNIENIQSGDLVYAKEAVGVEQSVDVNQDSELAPVLEVYAHEVDETYVVTVDGESIETTANHPFYDENGEQVEAKDLEEGDELTTANGDTATVDSVECNYHDEPVMVYNFCVMEDHTYFVGEHGVLVHNHCNNPLAEKITHAKEKITGKFPGKANANVGNGKQYSVLFEGDTGSGLSRSAHRNHANKQFFNTMKENADFKNSVDDFFGYDVMEHMQSGKSALKNPATDWVWHHAADRPGVMQLIPKAQHQSPLLQNILHPGSHGRGGFGIYY